MDSSKAFLWQSQLRFNQADPSGWMFFGSAFELMHACYEDFVVHLGFEWTGWFNNPEWALPIRATEAEYLNILRPGEALNMQVSLLKLGETSFTLKFECQQRGKTAFQVQSTHTFIDKKTGQKRLVPTEIRAKLETLQ